MISDDKISSKAEMAEYLKDKSSALQDKLEAEMDELKKQEQN